MNIIPFGRRLSNAIAVRKTPALVGLDPRLEQIPEQLAGTCDPNDLNQIATVFERFCCGIIDVVGQLVPVVKPQSAFFEQLGPAGMSALARVNAYAHSKGLIVLLDAKRGDIGSTATGYAKAFVSAANPWSSDALTVNPYLGDDSLQPFVDQCVKSGKGIFVLVKTSNPGSRVFQDRVADGNTIFEHVAQHVQSLAKEMASDEPYGSVGAVVGATHPQQLDELRTKMPNTIFLVPGFGAQGGSAADVAGAFDERGFGALINSSRGIIFAHQREEYQSLGADWQRAVERATLDMIEQLAAETNAGKLRQ